MESIRVFGEYEILFLLVTESLGLPYRTFFTERLENLKQAIVSDGESSSDEVDIGNGQYRRQMYHWGEGGGQIHNVPKDFVILNMTLGSFITCLFCGDRRERIPLLRYIQAII